MKTVGVYTRVSSETGCPNHDGDRKLLPGRGLEYYRNFTNPKVPGQAGINMSWQDSWRRSNPARSISISS